MTETRTGLLLTYGLMLILGISQVIPQGVFIHPVKVNGTMKVEFLEFDQPLDFDIHDESMFQSSDDRFEFPLTASDVNWLNSLFVLPKGNKKRVRKEYRLLTSQERENFHAAVNKLKYDKTVSLNKYDLLANIHSRPSSNTAAHGGPGFLGWHRVFLLLFENALRQKVPDVTIPYWDCTLDQPLSHPSHSVMWSNQFLGNGDGVVKTGPFKHWDTQFDFGPLFRQVSSLRQLMSDDDVRSILEESYLGNISYPDTKASRNIEQLHNNVHVWVGGLMKKIEIGAFDPVFYVLHSYIDKLWEDFRNQQRQKGIDPTKDYPRYYGRKNHAPFAPLGLGTLTVIDSISDIWMRGISYDQCPHCKENFCNSEFLKVESQRQICISKTKHETDDFNELSSDRVVSELSVNPVVSELETYVYYNFMPKTEIIYQQYVDSSINNTRKSVTDNQIVSKWYTKVSH